MSNKTYTAKAFTTFFYDSFSNGLNDSGAQKLADGFIQDFIHLTPVKLELIRSYLDACQFELFFQSLNDLKYLNEFSDNFNRYWYVIRAYSGALAKMKRNYSIKGSKKIYYYYYQKYGDRRPLRNEHWFEKKRWEFLDELQLIYSENELDKFMFKYQQKLIESLKLYASYVLRLVAELKRVNRYSKTTIFS